MGKKQITRLIIQYVDGSQILFDTYEIKKIKEMGEIIGWVNRARQVYEQLEPLFENKMEDKT